MAKERAGPCSNPWSTGRITIRPVPPSRPWFSMRARLVSVPGLSLPYQLRISRTRSFMTVPPCRELGCLGRLAPSAATSTAVGPTAVLALDPGRVSHLLELRARHPAQERGVELGLAVHAMSSLLAALVQRQADEHLLAAARAMPQRKLPVKKRAGHAWASATSSPSAASSSSMCARWV